MNTEKGAGLSQRICLKDISRYIEFMIFECVISEIDEAKKDTEMLRWGGRKISKFTWMSMMLRSGKWRQGGVGVLEENGKHLEYAEFD